MPKRLAAEEDGSPANRMMKMLLAEAEAGKTQPRVLLHQLDLALRRAEVMFEVHRLVQMQIPPTLARERKALRAEMIAKAEEIGTRMALEHIAKAKGQLTLDGVTLTNAQLEFMVVVQGRDAEDGHPLDLDQIVARLTYGKPSKDGIHFIVRPLLEKGLIERTELKRRTQRRACFHLSEAGERILRDTAPSGGAEQGVTASKGAIAQIDKFLGI